jgi:hypothetical protein
MSQVKEILESAYALVKQGWTKGSYKSFKREHDCFCAVGAVRQAAFGTVHPVYRHEATPTFSYYKAAMETLYKSLVPRGRSLDMESAVVQFNDKKATTKQVVTKAFRAAIAKVA